jgi:hypothetical protein
MDGDDRRGKRFAFVLVLALGRLGPGCASAGITFSFKEHFPIICLGTTFSELMKTYIVRFESRSQLSNHGNVYRSLVGFLQECSLSGSTKCKHDSPINLMIRVKF